MAGSRMSDKVPVTLYLPKPIYQAWVRRADSYKTRVHTLLEHAAVEAVTPKPAAEPTDGPKTYRYLTPQDIARIRHLNEQEWNDHEIARELRVTSRAVSYRRNQMGLPSYGSTAAAARSQRNRDAIVEWMTKQGGEVTAGVDTVADAIGTGRTAAHRALQHLQGQRRLVCVSKGRPGYPSTWRVVS